jgi:hypothetical protein
MRFKNYFDSVVYIQVNLGPFLVVNCMRWVFLKFNERLLALNHLFKYSNMVIMSLIKSVGLEFVTIILVSSANKTDLDLFLTEFGKSFI